MNKTNTHLSEWRLPVVNRIIRAEFLRDLLVFTMIDRNSDRAEEIGYWDATDRTWHFVAIYRNDADDMRRRARRLMCIIMRRYATRVTRLQTELVNTVNRAA